MSKSVIIIGGGGHAAVCADLARLLGLELLGFTSLGSDQNRLPHLNRLGDDACVFSHAPEKVTLINGIGMMPYHNNRMNIYSKFKKAGYRFETLVHPNACVAYGVHMEEGVQVMAGVSLQVGAKIEENVIVNTHASVDHHVNIGRNSHVCPGAVICGDVSIGQSVFVGSGVTIIQKIAIPNHAIIPAGTTVREFSTSELMDAR